MHTGGLQFIESQSHQIRVVMSTLTTGGHPANIEKIWTNLDYTFFALGGFYFLLVVFPLLQLTRLHVQSRLPISKWSTQKLFLTLLFFVNTSRCLFFILTPLFIDGQFDVYNLRASPSPSAPYLWILNDVCSLLFLSTFAALVLFWAEIIHQGVHHEPARYLRIVFMVVNVLVYLGNLSLLTYMVIICEAIQQDKRSGRPADLAKVDTLKLIDRIDNYYFCGLYIITCAAFLYYGGRLYMLLRGHQINSPGRKAKLHEVALVTLVCVISFLIRSVMLVLVVMPNDSNASTIMSSSPSLSPLMQMLNDPLTNTTTSNSMTTVAPSPRLHLSFSFEYILAYYIIAEILPAMLVLFILRKLPPSYNASTKQARSKPIPNTYTSVSKPLIQ